jgi:hypothetical protein
MRRLALFVLAMAFLFAVVPLATGLLQGLARSPGAGASPSSLTCTVRDPGPCTGGEVEVFRMSGATNAHAQTVGATYPKVVCCSGPTGLSTSCSGSYDTVLWLSATDNAHASQTTDATYTTEVCLAADAGIDCKYVTNGDCGTGYACLATISGATNAHLDVCDDSEDYDTKVCCAEQAAQCIDRLGDTQCDDPVNDPDDDGCSDWEEQAGAPSPKPGSTGAYDPTAWYDFYDVPVPAKADAEGANGVRNRAVAMPDVLAVLFYVGTADNGDPNANGVDYDTIKGVDLDGDTTNDITPPLHQIEEGVKYDRQPSAEPNPPWDAGPPSGAVNMQDVLLVLEQVGLACTGGPQP